MSGVFAKIQYDTSSVGKLKTRFVTNNGSSNSVYSQVKLVLDTRKLFAVNNPVEELVSINAIPVNGSYNRLYLFC